MKAPSPTFLFWILFSFLIIVNPTAALSAKVDLPSAFPGDWQSFGRTVITPGQASVTIANGFVADLAPKGNCQLSFRARAPQGTEQVQIWCAIRVKDRDNRYVVGLRGGNTPEVSLARYSAEGTSNFYGFAPLDFTPTPGVWYTVRVDVVDNRFQVYLNDDQLPRINVEVADNPIPDGGVALGGGWLPTEFSDYQVTPLTGNELATINAVGDQVWVPPAADREAMRSKQRAGYLPAKVNAFTAGRQEISLNGNWLFMPEQDLGGVQPLASNYSDERWHVLAVPSYWTPSLGWLHGEVQKEFGPTSPSNSRGPSDTLVQETFDRVNQLTFDYKATKIGWYRHYIDLPQDISGRHFELDFDAIAKISDIWVNGTKVGSHVGMFGEVDCDITAAVTPGRNVIVVRDVGQPNTKIANANRVEGVAVTMEVTAEALQSLPHGMSDNNASGIWQPVKLVVTNPVRVGEVFIQPKLDGASAQVDVLNGDTRVHSVVLGYEITGATGQLDANPSAATASVPAGGKITLTIQTPTLRPKLWSPDNPNLYTLALNITESAQPLDQQKIEFGFRTFEVKGNRLLLNGQPYWLRGGDHFPCTLRPNDAELAKKFITLAREGNVRVTRTHAIPFTEAWMKAADEVGMGVSYEGTWPWLMLKGPLPPADVLAVWKNEYLQLIHKYRNHASLLFWTVNNEMNIAGEPNAGLLMKKWTVLDDTIKAMRQTDPTRPIVAYSGYRRGATQKSYNTVVTPNHFDDGDMDDSHSYFGWYGSSFFHLFNGEYGKEQAVPDRPLISQEMSTGYPRDDGWPSRSYEFTRYVPQALVGNYSFEGSDPSIFLTRQAFMTKELAEAIRRTNRDEAAGVLHFAYLTFFSNCWDKDKIAPGPSYYGLQKALSPVMVSAELFGRHFYAGDTVKRRICIVNDSDEGQATPAGKVVWEIRAAGQTLSQGSVDAPAVQYYTNQWLVAEIAIPATLPQARVDAQLVVSLVADGQTVSSNSYDIVVATKDWANGASSKVQVYDPSGVATATLVRLDVTPVTSLNSLSTSMPLVVGDPAGLANQPGAAQQLQAFVEGGGHVLLIQPGASAMTLFPDYIKGYRSTKTTVKGETKQNGEMVTMHAAESPVFNEIEPLDTSFFEMGPPALPYACSGTFQLDSSKAEASVLADECDLHGGLKPGEFYKIAGAPLVELDLGKGIVLASEMMLSTKDKDPIAGRLLTNMIKYLAQPAK